MQRTFIGMTFLVASLTNVSADTSEFQGLYYPPGDTTGSWTCSADNLGEYGGALGVEDDVLHGTEWSCLLSSPKQTNDGTQFFGECSAEGTEYRDIITLRKTSKGLNVKTPDGELEWRSCRQDDVQLGNPTNWVSGYAMGVSETKVSNDNEEAVIFSCGVGTSEPLLHFYFETSNSINGPVAIIVDGNAQNFMATYNAIEIDTECTDCMKNYAALMQALFTGSTMTIVPNQGAPMTFDTAGAKEAFNGRICYAEDPSLEDAMETTVQCKFIADFKMMHWGKCRVDRDETSISFYTDSDIEFFIPIHLNDDKSTATGYWNGPTGGNHAHADLGEMRFNDKCWRNDRSSICYE